MEAPVKENNIIHYIKNPGAIKKLDRVQAEQLLKKLEGLLIISLFFLIPAFSVYYLVDVKLVGTYGNAVPIAQVNGHSMEPTLQSGEWVTYYTPDKKQIQVGSIIIYTKAISKVPVIHRVVAIEPDGSMITQGDNLPGTDQALGIDSRNVTQDDVIGIVGGPIQFSFMDRATQYMCNFAEIMAMGC